MQEIKRGDIFWAELSPVVGSEQKGLRPVLVIQNDIGNKHSPLIIVAIITSQQKRILPTHVKIKKDEYNLDDDSIITLEQIRSIDKSRIKRKMSSLKPEKMEEVNKSLSVSVGLSPEKEEHLEYVYLKEISSGKIYKIQKSDYLRIKNKVN